MPPHSSCDYPAAIVHPWNRMKRSGIFCGSIDSLSSHTVDDRRSDDIEKGDHEIKIPKLPPAPLYPGGTRRSFDRPPRNIHFEEEVEIMEIPNVREMPTERLREMYLSREEMSKIHSEAWEVVELMDLGIEYAETEGFSKRGLSDLRGENVERRRRLREQAYKIVFGMQAMNGGNGYSRQIMADLYTQVSSPAKALAHRSAMYDAMAVIQQQ